jgi:twitching motility protein PilT
MIIDPFLKLVETQAAQGLVIRSGAPPVLDKSGSKVALSMPNLDADMVEMILEEVASAEQRAAITRGGALETEYSSGGKQYQVAITRSDRELRIAFRLVVAGARAPARAPDPPSPSRAQIPVHPDVPIEPVVQVSSPIAARIPVVTLPAGTIARVLARAEHELASDVLLAGGLPARLRVGGLLVEQNEVVEEAELEALFTPLLDAQQREELVRTGSTDLAIAFPEGGGAKRWRANVFRRHGGLSAALRPIRTDIPSLRELGLPDDFHELTQHRTGLVLVTGMAGAGKSTTLVALVEHINRTTPKHVITLEDPIEYEYRPGRALVQQREIGRDVSDFATGLRAALRESPDIILLGEMRDRETVSAALTAAETGHLVLATLHAGSAAMAIDRIVDVFPEHQQMQVRAQLAAVLRAVITQILLPSTRPPARVAVFEKLLVTTAVAAKIRDLRGHQITSEIQKGRSEGMVSLELSMARLVRTGRLAMDIAMDHASDKHLLGELVRQS